MINLYYIHDPMCSWCYAFNKVLKQIESDLPKPISVLKLVGGLAADSIEPMPESLASTIQTNWKKIEKVVPHIQFNFDFWHKNQPVRSTYPSCRAVLAAKQQASHFEGKMLSQIQWAYYQNAQNPSLDDTLIDCAKKIGLNVQVFTDDYRSELINNQLHQQINFARQLGVTSYPSLKLQIDKQAWMIAIDYNNADFVIEQITRLCHR